ncbi:MAG: HAD-IA family hydrolase [Gammaproteobacteria bacterium]|nr:HAD-IA family hydrolase [Gammaproteobacteria bacterium]
MGRELELRAVLFDLDGTLADTALDMGQAINRLRIEHELEPLPQEKIRPWVSMGSRGLLKIAFSVETEHADYEDLKRRFLDLYVANLATHTTLFPGMDAAIRYLAANGITWGIVTNKPGWLTDPLLDQMALDIKPACVVSGDTVEHAKPHPAPVLHALDAIQAPATNTLFIGDADRDIAAGRAAGCTTMAATYGYITDDDDVAGWQADFELARPEDLLPWLQARKSA